MNRYSRLAKTLLFMVLVTFTTVSFVSSDTGPAHRKRQPRPIKLGTSGGNIEDHTSQFCCSGTLGAALKDAQGKMYVLSNNHVLGKGNKAHLGDEVSQPGNIDAGCFPKSTDIIGSVSKIVKFKFGANSNNTVDATIAEVLPGMVDPGGSIIDVKKPGQPTEALLGMRVKKSGRTSGLRRGVIDGLNVTVRVLIPNACGSSGGKVVRFTNQITITDAPGGTAPPFIDSGDSGSLLVQDVGNCPATLGLLFAGDDVGNAVANRIQNVLTALGNGMKVVGCGAAATAQDEDMNAMTLMHPEMIRAAIIQKRYEDALFSIPGVIGVGIGYANQSSRELALVVYTQRGTAAAAGASALPSRLDGMAIRKKVTGQFVAN